jgi:hypothetical protein
MNVGRAIGGDIVGGALCADDTMTLSFVLTVSNLLAHNSIIFIKSASGSCISVIPLSPHRLALPFSTQSNASIIFFHQKSIADMKYKKNSLGKHMDHLHIFIRLGLH